MGRAIGIDLGTTSSSVAVIERGEPKIIPSAEGSNRIPSVVAIGSSAEVLVGEPAMRQALTNPENTVFSIKRLIGSRFKDAAVQHDIGLLPYKIGRSDSGDCRVVMANKLYSPQGISAMILRKLRADAEAYLGERISDAVITVPAYFNDCQRTATKDAGRIAGLNVLRIISEPTAAALAYGLRKTEDQTIAVYHFGGGTLDVSVLDVSQGTFQVRSTNGDTHLGGDDFDQRIMEWACARFRREHGLDLRKDRLALARLREAAESAKCILSTVSEAEISLPFIVCNATDTRHLVMKMTRPELEDLSADLIERGIECCRQVLSDAGLTAAQIGNIILVGGQTRMPKVQESLRSLFGRQPIKGINPDEAVALGAAIEAGTLKGEVGEVLLIDVTPLTLGMETLGGVATPLIPRNTTIPTSRSQIFSTAADSQPNVEIHVLQGERPMAADNKTLGRFILDGILSAPRGMPQIEVTFDIDANGILNVSARDKGTGKEQKITITEPDSLTKAERADLIEQACLQALCERYVEVGVDASTLSGGAFETIPAEVVNQDVGHVRVRALNFDLATVRIKELRAGSSDYANTSSMISSGSRHSFLIEYHHLVQTCSADRTAFGSKLRTKTKGLFRKEIVAITWEGGSLATALNSQAGLGEAIIRFVTPKDSLRLIPDQNCNVVRIVFTKTVEPKSGLLRDVTSDPSAFTREAIDAMDQIAGVIRQHG